MNTKSEQSIEKPDLDQERNDRCFPVAKKIIELISGSVLKFGNITDEDLDTVYRPLVKEITTEIKNGGVFLSDMSYLFQLIQQPLDQVRNLLNNKLETALELCAEKHWGKKSAEVSVLDVDKLLS